MVHLVMTRQKRFSYLVFSHEGGYEISIVGIADNPKDANKMVKKDRTGKPLWTYDSYAIHRYPVNYVTNIPVEIKVTG